MEGCIVTKRKLAAMWSAEGLCESGSKCTFWTLTTVDEVTPTDMGSMWNSLRGALVRHFGKLAFFRVIEPHASGRRWHLHVIFDRSLPIHEFKRLAHPFGWGRISCARVRTKDLAEYCAKTLAAYCTKGAGEHKGLRTWSTSKRCPGRVRVADVVWRLNGKTWAEWFPAWAGVPECFFARRRLLRDLVDMPAKRAWLAGLSWWRQWAGVEWMADELANVCFDLL